ncbi:unnamed protein product [Meloidogyne enterolobii]|uniref:Uncharacterized protein n=1 Tax=Meloidogyne enterolobii TaxID=390850 RepID=A0ACB0YJP2_MELEN
MPRKYLRRMETISNAGGGHHSDLERIRRRSQESQQLQQENLHQHLLYSPAEMCRRRHSANVKRRRSSAASSSSNSRRSSSTTLLIGPSKREKSENEVNDECPSTLLTQNITKKQNGVSPNFILPTLTDKYNGQIDKKTCIDTNNPVQLILREISDASFATFL